MKSLVTAAFVAALLVPASQASTDRVFALLDPADHPESVAVDKRKSLVFVSTTTNLAGLGASDGRHSRIYVLDAATGRRVRPPVVVEGERVPAAGQPPQGFRGMAGLALDRAGALYVADLQGRVLRFSSADFRNPAKTVRQETYAVIPNLPLCAAGEIDDCSPASVDKPALPNDLAFDLRGNLYVTDSNQAVLFRIPAGGGAPKAWFASPLFDSDLFGLNPVRLHPNGRELYFAVAVGKEASPLATVYSLPLKAAPRASDLKRIYSWPASPQIPTPKGIDGLAFASGGQKLYVSLFGYEQISVLTLPGQARESEVIRSPLLDDAASFAFFGRSKTMFVPNHAFIKNDNMRREVLRITVKDPGADIARP